MTAPSEFLYHYCGAEALLSIVTSRTLWATDLRYLNDRFEGRLLHEKLTSVVQSPELYKAWGLPLAERQIDSLRHSLQHGGLARVACFSKHHNSLPMFRMYSPPAGGFAIGLPPSLLAKSGTLQACEYGDRPLSDWVRSYVKRYCVAVATLDESGLPLEQLTARIHQTTPLFTERLEAAIRYKKDDFVNEAEVRLQVGGKERYRASREGNAVIPYTIAELPNDSVEVMLIAGPNKDPALANDSLGDVARAAMFAGTKWQFLLNYGQSHAFRA